MIGEYYKGKDHVRYIAGEDAKVMSQDVWNQVTMNLENGWFY